MNETAKPIPERFRVGRSTLVFDRCMTHLIQVGGIAVILAVCAIFVFILSQILPLFSKARVTEEQTVDLGDLHFEAIGLDPWSELPVFIAADGTLTFLDLVEPESPENRGFFTLRPDLPQDINFPYVRFSQAHSNLIYGTDDGRFAVVELSYRQVFPDHRERETIAEFSTTPLIRIGRADAAFDYLEFVDAGLSKMAVAIQVVNGQRELYAVTLSQTRGLLGPGELRREREYRLDQLFSGKPKFIRLTSDTDFVIVGTDTGAVHLLARERDGFSLRQTVRPFAGYPDPSIHSMDFLFGDLSLIFTNPDGVNLMYSIFHDAESNHRILGLTKNFAPLANHRGADFFSISNRNKAFLIGADSFASLRYATTATIRWQAELPFAVSHALLGARYDSMLFVDPDNQLHIFRIRDRHPETGLRAYFGKIHYEGRQHPEYMWQSTGGGDDFEPKMSMVPLIIGTLKGTLYAMIIAVPIALLAALYTSQFLKPEIRRMIKPVMEIMESVPTVVLGFLAALWFAPIISGSVPSVFLLLASLPITVVVFGTVVALLPRSLRVYIKDGYEFLYFLPVMLLAGWAAWSLGPVIEHFVFVVQDPNTGVLTADFRLWWETNTSYSFEMRNALVVGIFMGFAIIPTIFTIAEDSMSNVPAAFRSGALALGASRWQTAFTIVLPTAAAGIFSALMIGFGRAVGETMILLMATGNTPVLNFNMFEGMRTLAANIAVELPEAAQGGSLYRSLFLGAFLLFLFTFIINTLAEILRQRLRERYKAVE